MPRLAPNALPSYRLHKQSGQAVVTLSGRDFLLGRHGSAESREEYNRRIAEWVANGRQAPRPPAEDLTIVELIARFLRHAATYYVLPGGEQSGEYENFRHALQPLRRLYGRTLVRDFGPLALKAVRADMLKPRAVTDPRTKKTRELPGWCRTLTNRQTARIRQVFKWAAENELVPAALYQALATVAGLRAGKSGAREALPVKPVADDVVDATLALLGPIVKAMVTLQRLTGMRAGELVLMRGTDIDRSKEPWVYRPAKHKTQHHGHERAVYLGPKAREILRPFLEGDPAAFVFSPAESERERHDEQRRRRKTPITPSQFARAVSAKKRRRARAPQDRYTVAAYRRCIARACSLAFQMPTELDEEQRQAWRAAYVWHPHQLRHAAGTYLRQEFGLEAAQVILGHKSLKVTELYAQANVKEAIRVMSEVG